MLEGLYAAAAGMLADQNQLDATAQNVSNEDTPGYQSVQIGFESLLYGTDNDYPSNALVGSGAAASVVGYDQSEGSVEQTGDPLNVAINGDGYFQVQLSNGQIGLTRNGDFQLDANGHITTSTGQLLVPTITVPKGTSTSDIHISTSGEVTANGKRLGKITVVEVPAPDQLAADGDSTYVATAASGAPRAAKGVAIEQGYLEQSNVDLDVEISNMESAQQGYEMASKAIQFESQMGQIAANLK